MGATASAHRGGASPPFPLLRISFTLFHSTHLVLVDVEEAALVVVRRGARERRGARGGAAQHDGRKGGRWRAKAQARRTRARRTEGRARVRGDESEYSDGTKNAMAAKKMKCSQPPAFFAPSPARRRGRHARVRRQTRAQHASLCPLHSMQSDEPPVSAAAVAAVVAQYLTDNGFGRAAAAFQR